MNIKTAKDLTYEMTRKLINYNPDTGIVTWKDSGEIASKINKSSKGYIRKMIYIGGYSFVEARVIWLYMTGDWPTYVIDHINRDTLDNRWCNLRDVPVSENNKNVSLTKNNKTGYSGIYLSPYDKYLCLVKRDNKSHFIGSFDTIEEAFKARVAWIEAYDKSKEVINLRPEYEPKINQKTGEYGICVMEIRGKIKYNITFRSLGNIINLGRVDTLEYAIQLRDKYFEDLKNGCLKDLSEYKPPKRATSKNLAAEGVYIVKGRYKVMFRSNSHRVYLGYFDTLEEAVEAKCKWLEENT